MRILLGLTLAVSLWAQAPSYKMPEYKLSPYAEEKLSPGDRTLFRKILDLEVESLWAAVTAEGFTQCFINELNALKTNERLVGRARTIRYLPNRPDLRAKLYGDRPQLNYVSSEDAQPGDVLVFDAGGEIRSAVTGNVTATRLLARGGTGMIADGAFRDVPVLAQMPLQIYMRRGQAAGVSPVQMSADYQIPVRIAGVTVIPGDILVGDVHGILVIPAAMVDKVVARASSTVDREEFQRLLLLGGESIYNVYPKLSDANQKKYEEYRKNKKH